RRLAALLGRQESDQCGLTGLDFPPAAEAFQAQLAAILKSDADQHPAGDRRGVTLEDPAGGGGPDQPLIGETLDLGFERFVRGKRGWHRARTPSDWACGPFSEGNRKRK